MNTITVVSKRDASAALREAKKVFPDAYASRCATIDFVSICTRIPHDGWSQRAFSTAPDAIALAID